MKFWPKRYSPWFILPGIAVLILFLVNIFRPDTIEYQFSENESILLMSDRSKQVTLHEITGKTLVDVRSPEQYSQGHLPDAVNIPVRQLLDKESLDFLKNLFKSRREVVLYGADELQATSPFFLLQQLGYTNIKLLKGGFKSGTEFKESELISTESQVFDTALIRTKVEIMNPPQRTGSLSKGESVILKRKGKTSGGGC